MFKKITAVLTTVMMIVGLIGVSAFAAEEPELPTYAPITLDSDNNVFQIDLASFAGIDADIVSFDITIAPGNGLDWGGGNGWFGGGGTIGILLEEEWIQTDYSGHEEDEISKGWAETAGAYGTSTEPYSFTVVLPEGTVTPYITTDDNKKHKTYGQTISTGLIQFGYWWGSNPVIDVIEFSVNFADGTSIDVIDERSDVIFDTNEFQSALNEIYYDGDPIVTPESYEGESMQLPPLNLNFYDIDYMKVDKIEITIITDSSFILGAFTGYVGQEEEWKFSTFEVSYSGTVCWENIGGISDPENFLMEYWWVTPSDDGYSVTVTFEDITFYDKDGNVLNVDNSGETEKTLLGDVNGDGSVTAIDARLALQAAAGNYSLDETATLAADVNGDGKVTSIDARLILQAAAGNIVLE